MRYATPIGFKMALEARLQQESLATGRPLQRLRQLVVFERFLARLFHSFGSRATLKGGMVLELRLSRARTTRDLDLRLTGHPEGLLQRLQEVGQLDLEDFFTFEVVPDAHHPALAIQGQPYEGQRYRVLFPLQVDRSPSGNPLAWSCFERRQQAILAAVASPRFFARLSAGVSQSSA
jgi:hypothetical protein